MFCLGTNDRKASLSSADLLEVENVNWCVFGLFFFLLLQLHPHNATRESQTQFPAHSLTTVLCSPDQTGSSKCCAKHPYVHQRDQATQNRESALFMWPLARFEVEFLHLHKPKGFWGGGGGVSSGGRFHEAFNENQRCSLAAEAHKADWSLTVFGMWLNKADKP